MPHSDPTRNLALELVRVTEAAALAAGRFMGRGDKPAADAAAVGAMRMVLRTVDINGIIVIGEGEKDNAPMLYNGETVGNGVPPDVDVAVDPIDGTRPLAFGRTNSLSTVALAPRGTMFDPGPFVYMNKLAVGPEAKGHIDIEHPITDNLKAIAKAKHKDVNDLMTIILDRPRHEAMIAEICKVRGSHSDHPRWRCGRGIDDSLAGFRRGRAHRNRRDAGGRAGSLCPEGHGWRDPGQALRPGRERAAPRPRCRLRLRKGPDDDRSGFVGRCLLRRHRHYGRGATQRRALLRRWRGPIYWWFAG